MTWRDTVQYYLSKDNKDSKDKDKQPEASTSASIPPPPATSTTPDVTHHNLEKGKEKAEDTAIPESNDAKQEHGAGTSVSLSRNASVARYKQRLSNAIPVGQFEIGKLTLTLP